MPKHLVPSRIALFLLALLVAMALIAAGGVPAAAQDGQKISRLGAYSGYSEQVYDEWVRTAQYVTARDGARIALDVVRPSVNGVPVDDPLPVILIHERYHRADLRDGVGVTQAGYEPLWSFWVRHGYVLASSDMRGTGASFGSRPGEFTDYDSQDAYDVIDWLAGQPWCNGRVGMMGVSANGISQFVAAGAAHPALRAIIPQMAMFDMYDFAYPGGIYREEFLQAWSRTIQRLDLDTPPVPVDEDTDSALARAAVAEHRANLNIYQASQDAPYRDSILEEIGSRGYLDWTISRFAPGINRSNVAVYQITGWYDMYPDHQALWFNNLIVPQRIVFTPFSHGAGFVEGWRETVDPLVNDNFTVLYAFTFHTIEHLRFFDYHLKDIDNGIGDEPPVTYYVMGAPAGEAWRTSDQWPLATEQRTRFYFRGGPSGSIQSANDGLLLPEAPDAVASAADAYTVDYSTATGTSTRWHNGHGGDFFYGDMSEQGVRSLTYTTPPLDADVEITGHPTVSLWVTSSADDGDIFAYLEEVDADGYAHYISEGMLRASHRATQAAPYNAMGLPWHRSFEADLAPLSAGEPVELTFALLPTSNIFDAGHRIRVRITGADDGNYRTPPLDPAPEVRLYRDATHPSYAELPVIPAQ
ncbi:MAG: CocE/NonD family hydrolase [Anaerolineae bacterium]|nr:CocE/NonD family hydrolase [Anaerolineae bacterium]